MKKNQLPILSLFGATLALASCASDSDSTISNALTGSESAVTNAIGGQDWTQFMLFADCDVAGIDRQNPRDAESIPTERALSSFNRSSIILAQADQQKSSPLPEQGTDNDAPTEQPGNEQPTPVEEPTGSGEENIGLGEEDTGETGSENADTSRLCQSGKVLFTLAPDGSFTFSDGRNGNLEQEEMTEVMESINAISAEDISSEWNCSASSSRGERVSFLTLSDGRQITLSSVDERQSCRLGRQEQVSSVNDAILPLLAKHAYQTESEGEAEEPAPQPAPQPEEGAEDQPAPQPEGEDTST